MPSKSKAQARLMGACAHGAGYDKCPPAKVAKEFNEADRGRTRGLPPHVDRAMKSKKKGGK